MPRNKRHACFVKVDRKLAREHNTRLVRNLLNPNHVFVETRLIEPRRGRRPKDVIATHCPFCGEKLSDA